jgi:hypothetical protein
VNNGRIRCLISRSDAAHNASVSSIDAACVHDQYGAAAGLGAARSTHQSQGAARPLADHDCVRRFVEIGVDHIALVFRIEP